MANNCTNCKGTGLVEVCHCYMYDCHEFYAIDYCTTKTRNKCPSCETTKVSTILNVFKTHSDKLRLLSGMSIHDFYRLCVQDSSAWPALADALEEIGADTSDINLCRHLAKYVPKTHDFYLDILTNTLDIQGRIITSTGVLDSSHTSTIIRKTLKLNNDTNIVCVINIYNNKIDSFGHEIKYISPTTFTSPENLSLTVIELVQRIPLEIKVEGNLSNLSTRSYIFHYLIYPILTNPIIHNKNCLLCKGSLDRMSCIECYVHCQRYISRLEEAARVELYHDNEDGMYGEELT